MPFGILGVIGGGYVMRRFQLGDKKAIALSFVASILSLVVGIPLIFVGCDTRPIAGLTTMLESTTGSGFASTSSSVDVLPPANCFSDCGCADRKYEPICADGIEYLSPCHAGCRRVEINVTSGATAAFTPSAATTTSAAESIEILSYSNCSCLANERVKAMPRACAHQCERKLWTGIGISCAVLFIICIIQSPVYIGED